MAGLSEQGKASVWSSVDSNDPYLPCGQSHLKRIRSAWRQIEFRAGEYAAPIFHSIGGRLSERNTDLDGSIFRDQQRS